MSVEKQRPRKEYTVKVAVYSVLGGSGSGGKMRCSQAAEERLNAFTSIPLQFAKDWRKVS